MRYLLISILTVCLYSCDQSKTVQPKSKANTRSMYTKLLTKFRDIAFDTLKVYSREEVTGEYKGLELDSSDATLFPYEIAQQHFNDPPGLFAIYKFPINDNYLGLITRTPSEYVPSSIKLFLLDKQRDTITGYIELAESWGDAGDEVNKTSWLYFDEHKKLKTFIWVQEGHDNSVDNEKDTTYEEWNYYYLLDVLGNRVDTISIDEKALEKKFHKLLEQYNNKNVTKDYNILTDKHWLSKTDLECPDVILFKPDSSYIVSNDCYGISKQLALLLAHNTFLFITSCSIS